jgi:undecaprenyl-diphosphatase
MKTSIFPLLAFLLIFHLNGTCLASPDSDSGSSSEKMTLTQAVVLGLVEGLTEYLPVSSTGHLTVAGYFMGIGRDQEDKEAGDAYAICIQLGAILAVLVLYRRRFAAMLKGVAGKDKTGMRLVVNTAVAFLPAAIIGITFEDTIKQYLFGMWPVIAAWLFGGIIVLFIAGRIAPGNRKGREIELLTLKGALIIGLFQCVAMWPGVSRSLATILGGIAAGLSIGAAVEFSFVLGLVTLSAATLWDAVKFGDKIIAAFGLVNPAVGLLIAGVSAFLSVRWMVTYLSRHSLAVFGWYRIVLALAVAAALTAGLF